MVRVELDDIEVSVGHMIGTMRQAAVRLSQFSSRTTGRDEYADHITGALGEMAVAKGLDLYWDASVNSFKSRPDVSSLEVRTTTYRPPRCSIYVSDRDDGAAKAKGPVGGAGTGASRGRGPDGGGAPIKLWPI